MTYYDKKKNLVVVNMNCKAKQLGYFKSKQYAVNVFSKWSSLIISCRNYYLGTCRELEELSEDC